MIRRRTGRRAPGRTSPRASSWPRSARLAKGLVAAGIEPGDRVAPDVAHPLRVDAASTTRSGPPARSPCRSTRPPRPSRWSGSSATRARAPCSPRRPRTRSLIGGVPRPAAGPARGLADRRPWPSSPAAPAPSVGDDAADRPPGGAGRRRPGHDHLHLGHHGPPQGLRADPPQPAGRRPQRGRRRAARGLRDRRAARRCCSCRWRTPSRGSSRSAAWSPAPSSGTGPTPARWPTGCRSSGPRSCSAVPRVFEKVFNSAQQQAAASGAKGKIFAGRGEHAPSPGARPRTPGGPGPGAAAAARPVRPAGLRQAAGRRRRPGAVRGLRRRAAGRAAGPLLPRRRA